MQTNQNEYKLFQDRLIGSTVDRQSSESSLSPKYTEISRAAEVELNKGAFKNKHIRSWSRQDDMGVPVQLRRLGNLDTFSLQNSLRFIRQFLPTHWLKIYFQKSALVDDLRIIIDQGFDGILKQNPVTNTPYVRDIYSYNKFKFNSRYLRYVYLTGQIMKYGLLEKDKKQIHVDIGNFYGGLQVLLKKYFPETTFISVELPHQLYRSYLFHEETYPSVEKFVGLQEFNKYLNDADRKPSFVYLLPQNFDDIGRLQKIDLITNFLSFGEMSDQNFQSYFNSITMEKTQKLYFVNRFISSPSVDPTFDSQINLPDYFLKDRKVMLLDVFPIHHYMITYRRMLGKNGFRNTSSPQFELIQETI
jgi:putative sugar O-methyltransferase